MYKDMNMVIHLNPSRHLVNGVHNFYDKPTLMCLRLPSTLLHQLLWKITVLTISQAAIYWFTPNVKFHKQSTDTSENNRAASLIQYLPLIIIVWWLLVLKNSNGKCWNKTFCKIFCFAPGLITVTTKRLRCEGWSPTDWLFIDTCWTVCS